MARSGSDAGMMNFRQVFSVIWRRKWIVVAIMALVIAAAWYWLQSQTPLYSTSSEVVIGIRDDIVLETGPVAQSQQQDFYFNETQAKIISSSQIAEEVAIRLDLFERPEQLYWSDENRPSTGRRVKDTIKSILPDPVVEGFRGVLNLFRGGTQAPDDKSSLKSMTPEEKAAFERQTLIRTLLLAVSVDPSERSRTITISAVSDKPDMAQKIANSFAEAYVASTSPRNRTPMNVRPRS